MIMPNKNIFIVAISFCSTAWGIPQLQKIDPKNMAHFNVRYLDCLEYETPEDQLNSTQQRIVKQRFDPNKYIDRIEQRHIGPVYIAFINDAVGCGVFAEQDIQRGQMIGEYTGIVKPVNFSQKKEDYDYAWGGPPPTKFVIDSKDAGNFTRFVNHSNKPNIDMIYVFCKNQWHLIYVANQDIKKDQQLLANYGKPYWKGRNVNPHEFKE